MPKWLDGQIVLTFILIGVGIVVWTIYIVIPWFRADRLFVETISRNSQ